jgi:TP901 family phage tail tape measure protein
MPEEITQRLGFNASRAIEELRNLQNQLNTFKQNLQTIASALGRFPTQAMPAIQAFRQLAIDANKAKVAMQGLAQSGTVPASVAASAKTAATSMSNLGQKAQSAGQKVQTAVTQPFSSAAVALKSLAATSKVTTRAMKKSSQSMAAGGKKAAKALKDTGEAGSSAAKSITLSWTTMARVVKTQILIRVLSKLISLFIESQKAAADFSISIGEVSTISTGALGPINQISSSVLELSRSLGLAADEIAEGLYQTLSNQVVDAADALRFTEQAAKLSIATNSQLKESVNALSSVMNSYGLDVSEVGHVSDVLFKTIELGRLRMGEFGDVLGRLTPLTATLGISFEEMSASLAALTQKGIPAHTAITQLTQVSQKLLRPTTKLQELYHEWGVETGPEAIRRFGGLTGVLLKMKDASAGNDAEFSNLLGRVRALVAGLNLTTEGASAVTKALNAMKNAAGASNEAFEEVESTIGRRAVKSWNDLSVSVLQFGEAMLHITIPITDVLGFLLKNFDLVIVVLVGLTAGIGVMAGAVAPAVVALTGLGATVVALKASLLSLWPIAVAVGAALAAAFIIKGIAASLDKVTDLVTEHKKQLEELTLVHEKEAKKRIAATKGEFEAQNKITGQYFSNLTLEYRKSFEGMARASEVVSHVLEGTLKNLSAQRQKMISEIAKAVNDGDDIIKESAKEVTETQESISETSFKRELKRMNTRQQLWAKVTRAQETATRAVVAYAEAGTSEEAIKQARELSHLAEKKSEEALEHAIEMKNYGAIKKAETALTNVRGARIRAEGTFQAKRKQLQTEVHKSNLLQLEEFEKRFELLSERIQELMDPLTSEGLKKPKQFEQDIKRAIELLPQLKEALTDTLDIDLAEEFGFSSELARLEKNILKAFETAQIDYSKVGDNFEEALRSRTYTADVVIDIKNPHLLEKRIEKFGEIDLRADAGRESERVNIVAQEAIKEFESQQTRVNEKIKDTDLLIDSINKKLEDENFFTWADRAKTSLTGIEEGFLSAFGAVDTAGTAGQALQGMLRQAVSDIREANRSEKQLSQSAFDNINALQNYASAAESAGAISTNTTKQTLEILKLIFKANENLIDIVKDTTDLDKRSGAYQEALEIGNDTVAAARDEVAARILATDESINTKNALEGAKEEALKLPAAAAEGAAALSGETSQAEQLKLELQGAVEAKKELNQIQSQPAGPSITQVAEITAPVPAEKTGAALEATAKSADRVIHGITVIDQAVETVRVDLERLPQIMGGLGTAAAQIPQTFTKTTSASGALLINLTDTAQQVQNSSTAMANLNDSTVNVKTNTDTVIASTANLTTNLNAATAAGYRLMKAMQAAAEAAAAAARATAAASGSASGAYYGGPAIRYRQSGGFAPRGKDRIPVMASAGEFFVNARNARRFSSELQAINAGSQPTYRDHGGPVTNVGDINVSVTQGEAANQTARQIAAALRRELRRGTSRLD